MAGTVGTSDKVWLTASQLLGLQPVEECHGSRDTVDEKSNLQKSEAPDASRPATQEIRDNRRDAMYLLDGNPSKTVEDDSRARTGISIMSIGLITGQEQSLRAATPTVGGAERTFLNFDGATTLAQIPETDEQVTDSSKRTHSAQASPRPSFQTGDTGHFMVGPFERPVLSAPSGSLMEDDDSDGARPSTSYDGSVEDNVVETSSTHRTTAHLQTMHIHPNPSSQDLSPADNRISSSSSSSSNTLVQKRQPQPPARSYTPSQPPTATVELPRGPSLSELDRRRGTPSMVDDTTTCTSNPGEVDNVDRPQRGVAGMFQMRAAERRRRMCGGWFSCAGRR